MEKLRSEIDDKYKWDLTVFYKNEDEFNKDKEKFKSKINELENFEGRITSSSDILYKFLKYQEEMMEIITNLYVYASSKNNEDLNNNKNEKMYKDIINLDSIYMKKSSFVTPELMKTDYKIIEQYIKENSKLKEFEFDLKMIYRYQPYTLTTNEEKLITNLINLQTKYENNQDVILNTLVDYGYIKDENGEEVKLTPANYYKYIKSKDRNVRRSAYINRGEAIKKYIKILSINYEGHIAADSMIAKTRGYNSDLEMYLFSDGVSTKIYDNLLKVADDNIDILYKYCRLIKKISKLNDFEVYDVSMPLTDISNKKYSIDECKNIICNALSILGDEYVFVLKNAFNNRWIDFYPNKGKMSGYYETASTKGNPIVLGNYNDDFYSVSAIAHELGHAVHSYFSIKNNPPHLSSYEIFVAEVASLTNEVLLSNYILNNSNDKQEKLLAIENILKVFSNNFFGTISEGSIFEREVHKRIDNGETLNEDDFNNIFEKILDRHYGPEIKKNDYSKYNWAVVSHFYSSFYYYKYSIGISCACFVAQKILSGDKEYLKKYLNFLTLGGSMMPLDELKTIDIDLTKDDVIISAINYFDSLIEQFEKIYNS